MCADCSATLETASMGINAVTNILREIQSNPLVVNLPRSLALTFKTTELASTEMTAAFPTLMLMLQKNQLLTVLLAMQEVVAAVEEDGDVAEDVDVDVDVVVVEVVVRHRLLPQQPLRLAPLLPPTPLRKRRMTRSK